MIHVDERRRPRHAGVRRQRRLRRDVFERAAIGLAEQRVAPFPKQEQIRLTVVVVVAGDRAESFAGRRHPDTLSLFDEPPSHVAIKALAEAADFEEVEIAVAVGVEQHHAAGPIARVIRYRRHGPSQLGPYT